MRVYRNKAVALAAQQVKVRGHIKIQAQDHSNEGPNPGWEEGSQTWVRLYQRDPPALLGLTQGRQPHPWGQ